MTFVFFIYGLAFFALGVTIFIYPKKDSTFKLANNLWLIASFGVVHGMDEWVDMFIRIENSVGITFLKAASVSLLVISYLFLLQFGVITISETKKNYPTLRILPVFLLITWVLVVISSPQRFLLGNICARYMLGIPGIYLTAYALFLQIPEFKKRNLAAVVKNINLSIAAFLLYGFFSGLIVPKAAFFPASIFNYEMFLSTFGFPIQVLRCICAVIITYAMIRILSVFEWETKDKVKKLLEKIQSAYGELEELQKIKDLQAHMIVHDLRNPLGTILGALEFLSISLKDKTTEKEKQAFQFAFAKYEEMKKLISNLLDISKMEEGKFKLNYEKINLPDLLRGIIDSINVLAGQETGRVIAEVSNDIPILFADKDILKRIIVNLVDNALKFSPSDSKVEVRCDYNEQDRAVIVSVKDYGGGIPREYWDKVFGKFFQVVRGDKSSKGFGLGLTFCKMAVEAHGGRIWVESEAGKGNIFHFTIPTLEINLRLEGTPSMHQIFERKFDKSGYVGYT